VSCVITFHIKLIFVMVNMYINYICIYVYIIHYHKIMKTKLMVFSVKLYFNYLKLPSSG